MNLKKFGGVLQKKTTPVASLLFEKFLFDMRDVSTPNGTGRGVNI
jgi:hypothetical protein